MAGWSLSTDSPSLAVLEIFRKLQSVGFCSDLENPLDASAELSKDKLSSLFDRILSVFLKEIHRKQEIRPLPIMLGDGQPVDMFKLYWVVREKGGYDSVTASRAWGSVAEGIGLDSGVGSSVKLIYVKYLDALDRWLQIVLTKKAVGDGLGVKENLGSLVGELGTEVRGIFSEISDQKKREWETTPMSGSKRGQFLTPERENARRLLLADVGSEKDDDLVAVEPKVVNEGFSSVKRKRDALVGMLNWVLKVAKKPGDPSIEKLFSPDGSKDKADHAVSEFYSQVLQARKVMFLKKIRRMDTDGSLLQKGEKVHPSIYAGTLTTEKIRCCQRLHSLNKPSYSCSEASTVRDSDIAKGDMASGEEASHGKRKLRNSSRLPNIIAGLLFKDQILKRIPVGSFFQVKVPDWNGKASETSSDSDDLKWLGTQIWPPENQEKMPSFEHDPIGKGRQDSCRCKSPGSVECVRFHVAEKRFQLKRELGSAFHSWRFDRMGEEVALSWTEEEARKFKAIVRLNPPSLNKNFWDQLHLCFPFKGRQHLVSYYFNVFLLGRRTYQNRVTPNSIDSDDDEETEFGFLSNPFGHDAIRVCDPKSTFCAQNAQCVDLDD